MQALERYGEAQLDQFEAILDSDEHDIYAWLTGKNAVPDEFDNDVMRQLLAHVYADK